MRIPLTSIIAGAVFLAFPARSATGQLVLVGGATHERPASVGSEYTGAVVIRNDGPKPEQVRVYLTDYEFHADGRSNFGEAGIHPRSNAKWIELASGTVTVGPGQSSTVNYRVSVPQF